MEVFNTESTVKFSECDRREPDSCTDSCSGNTPHVEGAASRTVSLFIVIIPNGETGQSLR